MGLAFFVATAGLAVAGYFGYRKLQKIEDEIRDELESHDAGAASGPGSERPEESKPLEKEPPRVKEPGGEDIAAQVLETVRQRPGILQTEIYDVYADRSRKELQAMLLKMDREDRVGRKKKGSTYQLFPV